MADSFCNRSGDSRIIQTSDFMSIMLSVGSSDFSRCYELKFCARENLKTFTRKRVLCRNMQEKWTLWDCKRLITLFWRLFDVFLWWRFYNHRKAKVCRTLLLKKFVLMFIYVCDCYVWICICIVWIWQWAIIISFRLIEAKSITEIELKRFLRIQRKVSSIKSDCLDGEETTSFHCFHLNVSNKLLNLFILFCISFR